MLAVNFLLYVSLSHLQLFLSFYSYWILISLSSLDFKNPSLFKISFIPCHHDFSEVPIRAANFSANMQSTTLCFPWPRLRSKEVVPVRYRWIQLIIFVVPKNSLLFLWSVYPQTSFLLPHTTEPQGVIPYHGCLKLTAEDTVKGRGFSISYLVPNTTHTFTFVFTFSWVM